MSKTTEQSASSRFIVFLCIFCVIFLIAMTYMIIKINSLTDKYAYMTLDRRLEYIEFDEQAMSSDITNTLTYDCDYEPEFDRFWEYSTVETAYLDGLMYKRAVQMGDLSRETDFNNCTQQIQAYIDTTDSSYFKASAQEYLDALLAD